MTGTLTPKTYIRILLLLLLGPSIHGAGDFISDEVANVPFGNAHVIVWKNAAKDSHYFALPWTCFDISSLEVFSNQFFNTTHPWALSFHVEMWSEDYRQAIFNYLQQWIDNDLVIENVDMIPMERYRLVFNRSPTSGDFVLDNSWKSDRRGAKMDDFQFDCASEQGCRDLEAHLKRHADKLSLELEYVVKKQVSVSKRTKLTVDVLKKSDLVTSLLNMPDAEGDVRYLRNEDFNNLTLETERNIKGEVITDHGYLSDSKVGRLDEWEDIPLKAEIDRILARKETDTKNFTEKQWDSVFWQPEFARPDKTAKELNDQKTKQGEKYEKESEAKGSGKTSLEGSASTFLNLGNAKLKGSLEGSGESQDKKKDEMSRDNDTKVEWNGEKFVVKEMKLQRINVGMLKTESSLDTNQVQRYLEISQERIAVRFDCNENLFIDDLFDWSDDYDYHDYD